MAIWEALAARNPGSARVWRRGLRPGQVFNPICYHEAAANLLTIAAPDPYAKTPEITFEIVRFWT